ncbi:MAG: ROK family protein [Victivallales bacterium]
MLSKTRKDRKTAQLKQYILRSGSITRAEAVENFDLDIRTASAYLEQLAKQGFCRRENSEPDGKGRPGIIYRENTGNMVFAGLVIRQSMVIELVLTDIEGNILIRRNLDCNSSRSKLSIFNSISETIKEIAGGCPEKILGGIGVAVSRWLQPPLASYDLYNGLAGFLEKESGVTVSRTLNINALAYDIAKSGSLKDVIVFHAGNVIELGIIQNGRNIRNYLEHENALAHLQVKRNGHNCYCGKNGCLEAYVTKGALTEKLSAIMPGAQGFDSDNPKVNKLKSDTVNYLVQACSYLEETYKPEQIFIMFDRDMAEAVVVECKEEKIKCKVSYLAPQPESIVRGAALLAAFMTVNQYK